MKRTTAFLLAMAIALGLCLSPALADIVLEVGSSGANVTKVQNRLIQYGYMTGSADGKYGEKTRDAVILFQKRNGLTVDGRVGKATAAALGVTLTSSTSSSSSTIVSADQKLLAKLVYAEARGESYKGQVAVAAVVLFVAAMQIQIAMDHGEFDAADVLTGAVRKMIARHAHVFGGEKAADADEVLKIWDQKKNDEKGFHSAEDRMRAVAKALPALLKAQKLWKKACEDDPSRAEAALEGVSGAGGELLRLAARMQQDGIDAEEALSKACEAFIEKYSRQ